MWSFFSKDPSKELVNFEVQEQIQLEKELEERTIWSLNNCKKKTGIAGSGAQQSNELLYSSFSLVMKVGNESWIQSAKNSYKRMKMLRHPNILMFQDGIENDKVVYIVTERVQPLYSYLKESKDNESQKENEISWGLHQIATALNFLNNDCKLVHNNVCMSSIVVNRAGEWKLTGFEYAHGVEDQQVPYKSLPILDCYESHEKSPINNLKSVPSRNTNAIPTESAVDSWGFGCLIWEIFNGLLPNVNALKNPGKIPKRLVPAFSELINAQPTKRLNLSKFLTVCSQTGGFMNNHFVDTLLFLEQIQIKDQSEKTKFFTDLTQKLDDFPRQLCLLKILPQLLNAYEFGNAGSSVLAPLFKLGKLLDENDYQKKIVPVVVKLFSSTDRATRMRLLQQLHLFVEHLSSTIINDQIFPNICQGFNDTNPAIREATIRSIVLIAPKLNYNNLNVELMKHFARLQAQDDQGMIRTNTTVCIGKIAPFINPQLRQRILLSAFPKAMRDPFPLARLSGIVALANTDRFYTLRDIATKVLPSICTLAIDPEKDVRDEAFKTIKTFTQKLEKVSENPELALEMEKDVSSCNLDAKNETTWTSWAMTSLSTKMSGYKNKNQQPSVALNTQPLGPPPGLSISTTTNSSTSDNKEKTLETNSKPKEELNVGNKAIKSETKKSETPTFDSNNWSLDDNEWKDLDDEDGDQMEPLESIEPASNFKSSSYLSYGSSQTNRTSEIKSNTQTSSNSDWSSWTNSFEDTKTNDDNDWLNDASFEASTKNKAKPTLKTNTTNSSSNNNINQGASLKSNTSQSQLPPASSYNWSSQTNKASSQIVPDSIKSEEDLFSSLVKDVSISNKTSSQASNKTPNESGWSNDWSEWSDNSTKAPKKQDREKQQDNETKVKQSKPLKLGQKKDPF